MWNGDGFCVGAAIGRIDNIQGVDARGIHGGLRSALSGDDTGSTPGVHIVRPLRGCRSIDDRLQGGAGQRGWIGDQGHRGTCIVIYLYRGH